MYRPIGTNLWFYFFVVAILEALAVYIWRFKDMPGAKVQVYAQLCKICWVMGMSLASLSNDLFGKVFWISIQQMSAVMLAYLWFLFITQISQQDKRIAPVIGWVFGINVAVLWLSILTNSGLGLYWKELWLDGQTLKVITGPMGKLALYTSYFINLFSVVLGIRWILGTTGLRRCQALWFSTIPIFSWLGHMMVFLPGAHDLAPQPMGFLITGILITWGFYRWRVYDIMPLAQDTVARQMIDGLLVVDEQDYIVEMNPAARKIMAGLPATIGGKFSELASGWPALQALADNSVSPILETEREAPEETRVYQVHMHPLVTAGGQPLGKVIVIKDITRQKQDQNRLLEQERVLSILSERDRLGRELHDTQGQFPGFVKTQSQAIHLLLNKGKFDEAGQQLAFLTEAAAAAFTDVRETISGLKKPSGEWDFFVKLRDWLAHYQKMTGIQLNYNGPETQPEKWILPVAEVQLLRVIQEALTNARKHSGATRIELVLTFEQDRLIVKLSDNGCGFDPGSMKVRPGSYGLKILQERAEEMNGICSIHSAPGQGTAVAFEIPLAPS